MQNNLVVLLALDVGTQRIGVAEANSIARIAHPLTTLTHGDTIMTDIAELIKKHDATMLVVGLPRGMQSQDTQQTQYVKDFVEKLKITISTPVFWQDEALTSHKAEEELKSRKKPYQKGDIDALAATYILEDFLRDYNGAQL